MYYYLQHKYIIIDINHCLLISICVTNMKIFVYVLLLWHRMPQKKITYIPTTNDYKEFISAV